MRYHASSNSAVDYRAEAQSSTNSSSRSALPAFEFSTTATATTTATPIKHFVVIFQENVSFDHYFGTYPHAKNPPGEPVFRPDARTPSVNGLTGSLLYNNTNSASPFRLDRSFMPRACSTNEYTSEQKAYHGGLADKFVEYTGANWTGCDRKQVMGYYDGNAVTALWNYAQNFAMSDNSFFSTFGSSTPGHLNLISGQTHGALPLDIPEKVVNGRNIHPPYVANGTVIGSPHPAYDDCSTRETVSMTGKNVGNLLSAKNITWGFFSDGFKPTTINATNGKAVCGSTHLNLAAEIVTDYAPHHDPFQFYKSTANPHHLPPASVYMIGKTDQANHQYDLSDFWRSVEESNSMPSVSFLKAAKYQAGQSGESDPIDEQNFLVDTINRLQKLSEWNSTAVMIAYDDSDGWYDHVMPPIISKSDDPAHDSLLGKDLCGSIKKEVYTDRCGYGPRQPFLLISPYAKINFVDHQITDTSSILRFIEDNWYLGRIGNQSLDAKSGSLMNMFDFSTKHKGTDKLFLHPVTGSKIS
jgi:phospholipase C